VFDWITGFVARTGYAGVFLLMFGENLVPPIPSEVIMPLAGFTAASGRLHLAAVVAAGAAGSLAGALAWYGVGRWLGRNRLRRLAARHGRWLTLAPEEVDEACRWFGRHGGKAVCLGRLVPAVRTLISVPAGIAGMPLPRFLAWSALGTLAWTAGLAVAGYLLREQYVLVRDVLEPATNVTLVLVLAWYGWRVATFGRKVRPR
jgi:membrane protein DedA with SNARE-associated domain